MTPEEKILIQVAAVATVAQILASPSPFHVKLGRDTRMTQPDGGLLIIRRRVVRGKVIRFEQVDYRGERVIRACEAYGHVLHYWRYPIPTT